MFGKARFQNYKGLKPIRINKEGEEEFYGYGYTGKYLNDGKPMDFGTSKPQLEPNNLGYHQYIGYGYKPVDGTRSRAE
ncbi:hypothetical protein MKW94_015258 [Papaver nudicaule]|uniref:Uncharacterized protein n=1 Tax=Papaver nudicaule TaxID=74823 RepID=A0AA41RWI9_PAPNU|nr:hypothetical protein [Papaver nudicaule]